MGILLIAIFFVLCLVICVCLGCVALSFARCQKISGYRLISLLATAMIPLLLLPLLTHDVALAIAANQNISETFTKAVILQAVTFSRTCLVCFLGSCLCFMLSAIRDKAIRRFSGVSWGFFVASIGMLVSVFVL